MLLSRNHFSISVVLPTYNRINRIKKCLPTFLATKLKDAQFIIIDNNSNDGTWDYLKSIAHSDKRVEIYKNPQNIGALKSHFRGFCEVKARYALMLSDDDLMVGDYISRCLEIFKRHEDVSMIHHYFNSLQKVKQNFNEKYVVHQKGPDTIDKLFMTFGVFMGIALRMKNFNLGKFPLDKNIIYPQVKIALEMTNNYKVAMINDSGLIEADFGDSIVDVKSRQYRPDCMGINERLSYALEIKNPLLTQKLAFRLARWAVKLFVKFEKLNTKQEIKFVKSLVFTLNNVTPYFIFCLFKLKKFRIAFYCIFCLILKPSFLINYTWSLVLVVNILISKLKNNLK